MKKNTPTLVNIHVHCSSHKNFSALGIEPNDEQTQRVGPVHLRHSVVGLLHLGTMSGYIQS